MGCCIRKATKGEENYNTDQVQQQIEAMDSNIIESIEEEGSHNTVDTSELLNDYPALRKLDQDFRQVVTAAIHTIPALNGTPDNEILIGGSTVEGAAIARYFQPLEDGGAISKNEEIEIDCNVIVAEIPVDKKYLIEEISGKPVNVRIRNNNELHGLISDHYKQYFQSDGDYVNSYIVKHGAAASIALDKHEGWLKGAVALAKDKNVSDIKFIGDIGEFTKPTAAVDTLVQIDGENYVNVALDLSVMLKINWTPDIVQKWAEKEKNWPKYEDISDVVGHAYLISKPSDPEKKNRHTTEFSISMHHIETRLAQLRTQVQQDVYFMFKSSIYCFIKVLDSEFTSFIAKTIMFKAQEKYPPEHEFWQDKESVIKYLIKQLLTALENGKLEYLFDPSTNIISNYKPVPEVLERLMDMEKNIKTYLNQLPIAKCLNFYRPIVQDITSMNAVLKLKNAKDFDLYPRIYEDQFLALRNKLGNVSSKSASIRMENSENLIDRSDELERFHKIMMQKDTNNAVIVHAIGGVGKTTFIKQYISHYKYDKTFWIDAEFEHTIRKKLLEITSELNLELMALDTEKLIFKVLNNYCEKRNLFVFDNVTNLSDFHNWLRSSLNTSSITGPSIIATSQMSDDTCHSFHYFPLRTVREEIAINYLQHNILPSNRFDMEAAQKYVRAVQCHTLCLRLALCYLQKHNNMTFSDLNTMINEDDDVLLYKTFLTQYGKPLCATLNATINKIFQSRDEITIKLLCIMGLMDGMRIEKDLLFKLGKIEKDLLHEITANSDSDDDDEDNSVALDSEADQDIVDSSDIMQALSEEVKDGITLALIELKRHALIEEEDEGAYTMHSLLQTTIRENLAHSNEMVKYVKQLLDMIESYRENLSEEHVSYGDDWVHHVLPLIEKYCEHEDIMEMMEEEEVELCQALKNKGDFKTLLSTLQTYLKYETNTNKPLTVTWVTRMGIAECFKETGEYETAVQQYKELLEECQQTFGEEDESTLTVKNEYGLCLDRSGNYGDARKLYEELYEVNKRVRGEDDESTLTTLNNLALCLDNLGEYKQARKHIEKVYEAQKQILGEHNPRTLTTLNNLAACLDNLGEHHQAKKHHEKVYEAEKQVLGEHNPSTLLTLGNLAFCLDNLGEHHEARKHYEKVYEAQKHILGEHNPSTLPTLCSLALCMGHLGEYHEERKMLENVLKWNKQILGEQNPDTLRTKYHLANNLFQQGELSTCLALISETHDEMSQVLADHHRCVLDCQKLLDDVREKLYEQGEISNKSKISR